MLGHRIDLRVVFRIPADRHDIYEKKDGEDYKTGIVESTEENCLPEEFVRHLELLPGFDEDQQGVEHDGDDTEFSGTESGIGKLEFRPEMRIHADVEGELQVYHQHREGDVQVEEGREAEAYEHQGLVDAVDGMVDVIAVFGPLCIAHAC